MEKKVYFAVLFLLALSSLSACQPSQAELDAQATRIAADVFATQTAEAPTPTDTPTVTQTPTSEPTATPTPTPTPTPLSAADVFSLISPSVAFIETSIGTGSGVLIEDGYVVTNAHVVWPFDEVRVVFPDGSEHVDAPVANWDLLGDLAIIGPLETSIEPVEFTDGENLGVGTDVFLIGYPGEADRFPQPTFTRGLISRLRQWDLIDMTYFQTDALIAGGQSGGVLASQEGEIIGISGLSFTEAGFGLVASAADVLPRIERLIAGEDVAGLGDRRFSLNGGQPEHDLTLRNFWDTKFYLINEPVGTEIEVEVTGSSEPEYAVIDVFGYVLSVFPDDEADEEEAQPAITDRMAPYFLFVAQAFDEPGELHISSDLDLIPYDDVDDGTAITVDQTLLGNIDVPGDLDYFVIDLTEGEIINIAVDSINIDPYLTVAFPEAGDEQILFDDDSGGGFFGESAELTYQAPHDGSYFIIVDDVYDSGVGGYAVSVGPAPPGATPAAPAPTPTPTPTRQPTATPTPIPTPAIPLAMYESPRHPFTMQYPAHWIELPREEDESVTVASYEDGNAFLFILEEDLIAQGIGELTPAEYVDAVLLYYSQLELEVVSNAQIQNGQGRSIHVIEFSEGPTFKGVRFIYVHENKIGFNATYTAPTARYQELKSLIDFSFSTFQVRE